MVFVYLVMPDMKQTRIDTIMHFSFIFIAFVEPRVYYFLDTSPRGRPRPSLDGRGRLDGGGRLGGRLDGRGRRGGRGGLDGRGRLDGRGCLDSRKMDP